MRSRPVALAVAAAVAAALLLSLPTAPVWCVAPDHARAEAAPGSCCVPASPGAAAHDPVTERRDCTGCRDISLATAGHSAVAAAFTNPRTLAGRTTPGSAPAPSTPPRPDTRLATLHTTLLLI